MNRVAATLAVLAGVWTCSTEAPAAPDPHAVIDRLPELATISRGRTRVVIRGELSKSQTKEAVAIVDQVVADVQTKFTSPAKTQDPDVTLVLFANDARYHEVAKAAFGEVTSSWGFYMPSSRIAIANYGVSIGNLRHELVHALIGDDFPGIPPWMNEGIGALYGTAAPGKSGFTFLVNYRLKDLQRALTDKTLPTFTELTSTDHFIVHGDRAMVWYAMGRYVLLYLDRKGKLTAFYRELRDGHQLDGKTQLALLQRYADEADFRSWARKLRL
jgi:hypothetical protein